MFKSMTAFARYKNTLAEREITIEIKSVNNRFLECQTRLPRALSHVEQKIKPYLSANGITRGKGDVNITVNSNADDTEMAINYEFADKYIALLRELKHLFFDIEFYACNGFCVLIVLVSDFSCVCLFEV